MAVRVVEVSRDPDGAAFTYAEGGAPEGVTGTDVEGIPVTVLKAKIDPADWQGLEKELPAKAPAEPDKPEGK